MTTVWQQNGRFSKFFQEFLGETDNSMSGVHPKC
jgi:hypothetical protein